MDFSGKLVSRSETVQVNDRFKKREFVIETQDGEYKQYIKCQATQNRCDILNGLNQGQELKITFNLRGNKWEKDGKVNYITNVEAWKIEKVGDAPQQQAPQKQAHPEFAPSAADNEVPF